MSLINISYNEDSLYISFNSDINERKLMKVKIFLNSLNDVSYKIEDKRIIISFNIDDNNLINKLIKKITSFLSNTFSNDFSISSNIDDILNDLSTHETNLKNQKEKLTEYKKVDLNKVDEFNNFKVFCDSNLSITLRPYQYTAAFYLVLNKGGFDFSVPGAGKTIITYASYEYFRKNEIVNYMLIIGPMSAYHAWFDEYKTCFNSTPNFIDLSCLNKSDLTTYLLSSQKNHKEINFINIDKAWRFESEIIKFLQNKNVLLVVDEAHKEKNPDASITKAVLNITKYCKLRILLTGTPMPNGYEDLLSLTQIYAPYDRIIPYSYRQLSYLTKKGASLDDEKTIMNSIKPFYSRVSKKYLIETNELKVPNITIVNCDMSNEQLQIYDYLNNLAQNMKKNWDNNEIDISLAKAILIRKMQVSANPSMLLNSIINSMDELKKEYNDSFLIDDSNTDKLLNADRELKDLMNTRGILNLVRYYSNNDLTTNKNRIAVELAIKLVSQNKKVIIWETFVQNMYALKNELSKIYDGKVEIINGAVVGEERENSIDNFKNKESMILIANPSTLAESISLHRACQNAIYVNRNYNAAQFIQSKDRIHRINMPEGTTANYYFLINNSTVDEEVDRKLKCKEERMLRILDSDDIVFSGSDFESTSFMSDQDVLDSYDK